MNITIRDVAKRLNLSITTVSRALDGYDDVSEETRQRVVQTAHEMGYAPNQAARQLRRKRADSIGYILPADRPRFSDPFFAEFVAGLGDEAAAHGLDLLVSSAPPNSQTEQRAYERWIQSRKVDGLVLNRLHLQDLRVQYLARLQIPFVTLERSLNNYEYPSVEVNGRRWFKALVDHLVGQGHRRIVYIGAGAELKLQADRLAGYRDSLQSHGLPYEAELVTEGDLTSDGGFRAAEYLLALPHPPTAIACVDDMTALGVLHAAREHGRIVGQDLAVAGFDGIDGCEHTQPLLTTINQPVYQIARKLAQMLTAQIAGQALPEQHLQIELMLEVRQSTVGKYSLA